MREFNYANYAKTIELGIPNPNMTMIAKCLFEPLITQPGVVNHYGNPYNIDSKQAKAWYNQKNDIPVNLKKAAGNLELINSIGDYFSDNVIDELTINLKESQMHIAMNNLIRQSNLADSQKTKLLKIYDDGDMAEFLGRAFLYAVVGDNKIKDAEVKITPIDDDIRNFKELIKKNYKKPERISPPDEIEDHELGYINELYLVYKEETGEDYARPEDLNSQPKLKKNFNRQRKDYYSAETIRRELRDVVNLDESDGFDELKDEMFDGVITTRDKDYDSSYIRLNSVMEHATKVPISNNLNNKLLDWVGPGEKKGVCHMLVNDGRMTWRDDEDE